MTRIYDTLKLLFSLEFMIRVRIAEFRHKRGSEEDVKSAPLLFAAGKAA